MASDLPAVSSGTLLRDFDPRAITGVADGGAVATLPDTVAGSNATQATAAKQPTYVASAVNAQPGLSFDGADDCLTLPDLPLANGAAFTIFFVATMPSGSSDRTIYSQRSSTDGTPIFAQVTVNNTSHLLADFRTQSIVRVTSTSTFGASAVIAGTGYDGTKGYVYFNGTQEASATGPTGTYNTNQAAIGAAIANTTGGFLNGTLMRLVLFSGHLSDADRATIDSHLSDTYGITVSDYVASGGSTFTGSAASTLPGFTQSATASTTAPTFTGTTASTLPGFTQAAQATTTAPVFTATGGSILPAFTQAAAASASTNTFTATAASTLPAFTQQAVGSATTVIFTGTAASSLPAFTQAAVGVVHNPATALPGKGTVVIGSTGKNTVVFPTRPAKSRNTAVINSSKNTVRFGGN